MPIIIHAGHPKTGSSAIQTFLSSVSGRMQRQGYLYVEDSSFHAANQGLATCGNLSAFMDFYYSQTGKTYVFSSEYFFEALAGIGGEFAPINAKIRSLSMHIDIIFFYTRDLYDYVISTWSEAVKRAGYTGSLDEFACDFNIYGLVLKAVQTCEELGIHVELRNYSRVSKTLISDFAQQFLPAISGYLLDGYRADIIVNRSLSYEELELQRLVNRYLPLNMASKVAESLVAEVAIHKPVKPQIGTIAFKSCAECNQPSAKALLRYLPNEHELNIDPMTIKNDFNPLLVYSVEQLESIIRSLISIR